MRLSIRHALYQAQKALYENNLQVAKGICSEILRADENHHEANYYQATVYTRIGMHEVAIGFLQKAIESRPQTRKYWHTYIEAVLNLYTNAQSEKLIKKAYQLIGSTPLLKLYTQLLGDLTINCGTKCIEDHDGQDLESILSISISSNTLLSDSKFQLTNLIETHKSDNHEHTESNCLAHLNEDDSNALAWKILGILYIKTVRYPEAIHALRKALELDEYDIEKYQYLAHALHKTDRLKDCERTLRDAIELDNDNADAHYNLGVCLGKLQRPEEAEQSYSNALIADPLYKNALINRGIIYLKRGDYESALKDFDASDSHTSRYHSLSCLYAVNKIDEIYDRLRVNSDRDKSNIGVAAFASFLLGVRTKQIGPVFCEDPLSYIYFSDVFSDTGDQDNFVDDLVAEIKALDLVWEPNNKNTHNGFQTAEYINIFRESTPRIRQLKEIIISEIDKYLYEYKDKNCFFITNWPATRKIRGWSVILNEQGYQHLHYHIGGWLSGVIYLSVVPSPELNEGAIEFTLNGVYYSDPKSKTLLHQPKVGDIILFPSSLHHRTLPFKSTPERICIAFDLLPE